MQRLRAYQARVPALEKYETLSYKQLRKRAEETNSQDPPLPRIIPTFTKFLVKIAMDDAMRMSHTQFKSHPAQ